MLNSLFGPNPDGEALERVVNFIRAYYLAAGVKDYDEKSDKPMLGYTLAYVRSFLRHLDNPSVFKKIAVFTHVFIFQCPLGCNLPDAVYPAEVPRRSYHNAVVAFEIAKACLHGAVIGQNGDKRLLAPIEMSRHQHKDLMIAFCEVKELKDAYTRLIALIYETLSYEANDGIRYNKDELLG